ncbi:MAG: sulfatase-like hydrolase/transferase [Verrucomicrobiota bacterium JB023]|nr:sulfatase-like hydrolase/transferase [Verrucomicrobiota bacterium JB023]
MRIFFLTLLAQACLAAERPNILFLFTDDQTYEAIGAAGLQDIDTPHLDRLTKEGVTFSHAYNMGAWSGAVCVASRTCLVTGKSLWRAKDGLEQAKQGDQKLWSQLMTEAGYETYLAGKWHVDYPADQAFAHTANVRPGMPRAIGGMNRPKPGTPPEDQWKPWDKSRKGFWEGGKHWSEVTADDAIGFLNEAKDDPAPFFMYIAFNAPHDPRQSPKEFIDRYPLERIQLPESFQPTYPDQNGKAVPIIRDEKLAPFPRTEHAVKVHRQEYFALVTHLDEQIGRILDSLQASGKAKETWIIFTSDHGLAVGNHGLLGKQNMYEHSLRVPFIISGPGLAKGRVIDAPIYLQDAMPTALEIAGLEVPAETDYRSLLPLLKGEREENYQTIYGAYLKTQRALVKDHWKLISYPRLGKFKLFNLRDDPHEMDDLASAAEHSERLDELTHLLNEEMDQQSDPLAQSSR